MHTHQSRLKLIGMTCSNAQLYVAGAVLQQWWVLLPRVRDHLQPLPNQVTHLTSDTDLTSGKAICTRRMQQNSDNRTTKTRVAKHCHVTRKMLQAARFTSQRRNDGSLRNHLSTPKAFFRCTLCPLSRVSCEVCRRPRYCRRS